MANVLNGVKCSVKNCNYWEDNYKCSAPAIEVNVDNGGHSASKSRETNCQTFRTKA
ncbi:MAG TPA: DUF1540 domain-containing protein [Sporomusaceae bacterium]|jgi:hypothetical protein|uniref:DUF1540 domain-containing protein n=1 Tax=Anaerospora sp. TaxID=1960278 RepID=UPI000ED693AB|nr:DUF1540 domain-containing protein [Anaerospora sp.]MDF2928692.1 hypothetical protein [Anaerospora sp.]HAK73828.1 DUF1540 domain-containing protein [Sporomusaceae bacterium]